MKELRVYFAGVALIALYLVSPSVLSASTILGQVTWATGNGNTYAVVELQGATWDEAQSDVESVLPGFHVATLTSQDEQDFVDDFLINEGFTSQYWLGGFQVTPKPETDAAAGWEWVTGEAWGFTNWGAAEPNNAGGFEDHLATSPYLGWNDEGSAIGSVSGYIAEQDVPADFPYIGDAVPGIILDTQLAPDSGGSAGAIQTGGLMPGVEAFVDRIGQLWQVIPTQLIGADFIQTAQDNADFPYVGIDVYVANGTILHMLVPEHDDLLPFEWMNEADFGADWVNTGAVIITSWSSPAQVWSTATPLPAGIYRFRELPTERSFYGIAATQSSMTVMIDIKPGSETNPINCGNPGVVPVAVLGATDFDATQVDASTVRFGPGEASPVRRIRFRDVNRDGLVDAVFFFRVRDVDLNVRGTTATLIGATSDSQILAGTDTVEALHCGRLMASFADDMQGGGLPHGSNSSAGAWIYGWNSVGDVDDPAGIFSWLLPTDSTVSLYDTDGDAGLPDEPPGAFAYIGWLGSEQSTAGGHPGQGYEQNEFERYVMALFVLPDDGLFEIQNSIVQLADPQGNSTNSDGLSYFVTVLGDEPSAVGLVEPGYLNSGSFDVDLGYQTAGEFVVVGIGSRGSDTFDTFSLGFDIVDVRTRRHRH